MIHVSQFSFNPFEENTYVLHDDSGACLILDPGCIDAREQAILGDFIAAKGLRPELIVNTHAHIDHIFGNAWARETYQVPLCLHRDELPMLQRMPQICGFYGLPPLHSPEPDRFLEAGETLHFGESSLQILLTPGHSPASLSFYSEADQFVIAGDVLFFESIGRTDLPGGDLPTLLESIRTQLFPLGDRVKVWPGHGIATTIGFERKNNPFLRD